MKDNVPVMYLDLTGQKFGRWTAIRRDENLYNKKYSWWVCECECGTKRSIRDFTLVYGMSKSCGCYHKERIKEIRDKRYKHDMVATPTYNIWAGLRQKCYGLKHISYKYYGAVGIRMCDEWFNDFTIFHKWIMENGWKPGLILVRIDEEGDFCPENCKLIPKREVKRRKRGKYASRSLNKSITNTLVA
jgi:hypothetical protein